MTGEELRQTRQALGLSSAELGLLLGGIHAATICRWERSIKKVPAWSAGVLGVILEGHRRQAQRLPLLADALRSAGAVSCLALWGMAASMPAREWWVWARRSTLAPVLRASNPPPCPECRGVGGTWAHKMGCTRGAALRQGADPAQATVVNGVLLCRPCKELHQRHVRLSECRAHGPMIYTVVIGG